MKVKKIRSLAVSPKALNLLKKYKKENKLKNMDIVIKELLDKSRELEYLKCSIMDCPVERGF